MRIVFERWEVVPGRGSVAVCEIESDEPIVAVPVNPGDAIRIDGTTYRVRGVECSQRLTAPPSFATGIGILVQGAWNKLWNQKEGDPVLVQQATNKEQI